MSRDSAVLLVLVIVLLSIGLVMLFSATAVACEKSPRIQDAGHFLKRQLVWTLLGLGAMALAARVRPDAWARWRIPILGATVVLLALVFVPGVGATLNAARRWIRVGGFFFQPSEFAKIGIAVFVAGFAAAHPDRLKRFFAGLLPAVASVAAVCGLILVEPDVGTSLFIAMVMGLTLMVAGVRWTHVLPLLVGAGGLAGYFALAKTAHVSTRIEAFLHPERDPLGSGHQIIQSLLALGAGGWTGEGLGRGTAKLYFLPESHSDFILPVIGEELGFAGTGAILVLYFALGLVGYRIMRRAPDRFGFLLSFAVTTYIILQAAVNVAVVTASMPTKGIPLPFISAGGSSVVLTLVGVGMLIGVSNAAERGPCQEGVSGSSLPGAAPGAMSFRGSPSPGTP